jgi:hypothetical protein
MEIHEYRIVAAGPTKLSAITIETNETDKRRMIYLQ